MSTELTDLPICKILRYYQDRPAPEVAKDGRPERTYIELSRLEFPKNWYYRSTVERFILETTMDVGGHAVLLMEMHEEDALDVDEEASGGDGKVYLMSVEARIILFYALENVSL